MSPCAQNTHLHTHESSLDFWAPQPGTLWEMLALEWGVSERPTGGKVQGQVPPACSLRSRWPAWDGETSAGARARDPGKPSSPSVRHGGR